MTSLLTGRSGEAAGAAVNRLAGAGILVQRNVARHRYPIFEAPAVLEPGTAHHDD